MSSINYRCNNLMFLEISQISNNNNQNYVRTLCWWNITPQYFYHYGLECREFHLFDNQDINNAMGNVGKTLLGFRKFPRCNVKPND